jgi:hypothetical protein
VGTKLLQPAPQPYSFEGNNVCTTLVCRCHPLGRVLTLPNDGAKTRRSG